MEYEPVLLSSQVTCNIFRAKTENRFKSCTRDLETLEIKLQPKDDDLSTVVLKCYQEKVTPVSAYIQVAKVCYVEENETKFVKGRVINHRQAVNTEPTDIFEISDSLTNPDKFHVNCTLPSLPRKISLPITNDTNQTIRLKRGDILADISILTGKKTNLSDIASLSTIEESKTNLERSIEHLNDHDSEKLKHIVQKHTNSVSTPVNKSNIPYEHSIDLEDDIPVVSKHRIIPHAYHDEIYNQIDKLLQDRIIESSDSKYSSPVVPVIKKDGLIRLCCDFRKLNAKTVPKTFPIPRTEDLLEDLKGAEVFTILDLKSAYWHNTGKRFRQT